MEFLDPKKQKQHLIRLAIGYILIGIALILTTIILLYHAYGFGLKNGEVIQNGLIFVSSSPNPADIYVNGQKHKERTNVRLLMPAGQYAFELKRDGYRPWKRAVNLEGGSVARFDYPMLFPAQLATAPIKKYALQPGLAIQSPDRKWIVVQAGAAYNVFDVFDTSKKDTPAESLTLPESISKLTGTHSWKFISWANDNTHILLQHVATDEGKQKSEYILVNREDPAKSVNLTSTLGVNPVKLELRDKKYDKYFIYDDAAHTLSTASLAQPKPELFLDRVFGYKTHGEDTIVYATDQGAPAGKAVIRLLDNTKTYSIRQVAAGSTYLLDLARYSGDWYVAAGAASEGKTYVYKNPAGELSAKPDQAIVPVQVLKANNPQYLSFSENTRFIMIEGAQQFAVYDAETEKGYRYTIDKPMDALQEHATWMDGHRLTFTSKGRTVVFDFDKTNQTTLAPLDPSYRPFFDRDYEVLYSVAPQTSKDATGKEATQFALTRTPLRTTEDQ